MSGQTVWREGVRIRRTDGTGFGDLVTDSEIREHISWNDGRDPLFEPFALAVLAIRAFERATACHQSDGPVVAGSRDGGDGHE